MLIGFDAQATRGRQSGLGFYTRNLLRELEQIIAEPLRLKPYREELPAEKDFSTFDRLRWANWTLPGLAKRDKVDLLHVPAFAPPVFKPCPMVVTVPDIAGMLFPNQIGRPSALYWGKWLPFTFKKADRLIAISEHTKQDLVTHLGIKAEKIRVIYLSGHENFSSSVSSEKVREAVSRIGIIGRYFLFVGTMEPRKNLGRILDAFKLVRSEIPDIQLVLVGSKQFAHGQYAEQLAKEHDLESSSVIAPGFLAQEDLNALYCGALGLLFPSLYEGFGIPILEAMASGCPVLTSSITSTPEVAGDAGILVDPYKIEEIARGIRDLAKDDVLCAQLRQQGFNQIKKFSWQKTARKTLEIYKEFL